MKTIELIEKVKRLGLETDVDDFDILIVDKEGRAICSIRRNKRFQFNMDWYATELIGFVIKEELFRIVCQYASTPIDEREKVGDKMKFTKENVINLTDKWFESKIISFQDLLNEIKELDDTPGKVVVPKFVAEWIQSYLNEGGTPIDVLGSLMSFHASFVDESVIRWFKKNSETMLKALANGYTIEPEKLYYIPLPDLETSDGIQQVLTKRSKNGKHYFASRPNDKLKQRYTKDEIAQVPEIYKYYATLIEEEEE